MHSLIVGMTESGKTTLAKILCGALKNGGNRVAVLDPLRDDGWNADYQTQKGGDFLAWCKMPENRQSYLFVDEGSISVGRFNREMEWLATLSRHWGHSTFFIAQSAVQISPIIRANCSRLFLFASTEGACKLCAEEFNEPALKSAPRLPKGHYYKVYRFGEISKNCVDFANRTLHTVA